MVRNTEKVQNEKHNIVPGIWQETVKNMKNEKLTRQDMKYGEKHRKPCKMRNTHGKTWNMKRNSEKPEK